MAAEAVSRIASLASDALVNIGPAISSLPSPTSAITIPVGGDAISAVLSPSSGQTSPALTSILSSASVKTILNTVLRLDELAAVPVVFHFGVDAQGDLSDVLLLRNSVSFFLLSNTAQQAHDHALLASRLARTQRTPVVHVFYQIAGQVEETSEDAIMQFLYAKADPPKVNGSANGYTNGHANGLTNGHANGHANDHSNGHANGHPNGTEVADSSDASFKNYETVALETLKLVRRAVRPFATSGSADSSHTVIFTLGRALPAVEVDGVLIHSISLASPLPSARLLALIPTSASSVFVIEDAARWSMKWTPLYLDIITALQAREPRPTVRSGLLGDTTGIEANDILKLVGSSGPILLSSPSYSAVAANGSTVVEDAPGIHIPKHEGSYTKVLQHLFGDRLEVANSPELVKSKGELATTPEFALGRVRAQLEEREKLVAAIEELLASAKLTPADHAQLSAWLLDGRKKVDESTLAAYPQLSGLTQHLPSRSRWIIGSDAWAYDIGSSGLHHLIASALDVNILIIDSTPYTKRTSIQGGKRDIGLYAMNHGDVYVASVAVYAGYAAVLQACTEADAFRGPSVVLAYLPHSGDTTPALEVLKETKMAVDAGWWPLYRWNPSKEEPFTLDGDAVKNDLKAFLDRQNHISQLVRKQPQLAAELVGSLGASVREARRKKAEQAYEDLLGGLDAPSLVVLFASDGGNAEKKAKRLVGRAKARGVQVQVVAALDTVTLDGLKEQDALVIFVTSTAGQGEPPQNARSFFKALNAAAASDEKILPQLKYGVFGMGDSHYWPRKEDAHYYNKPSKDLDARLEKLGGERVVALGLGDDQDADGAETGLKPWEALLWKALGVDGVEVTEVEPEPITNEHIKAASGYLRGTIAEGLEDSTTGALAPSDGQLTKFHGIYQQDDRDIREEREGAGAEPAYSFMIRVRMPGGVCTPWQWNAMDRIADERGNGTFKITTRATFQFHGVIKKELKPAIGGINRALLDTLAACGDVNRNVICSSVPSFSKLHAQVFAFSVALSEHLVPRTTAYHEIWLDGIDGGKKKLVAGEAVKDFEPLYGEFYLPRKFKIAVAVPPTNDVDVFANDLGFIAIVNPVDGSLAGFNVSIGGGMGVTHGNKKTYPRAGSIIGFVPIGAGAQEGKAATEEGGAWWEGCKIAEAVMIVQRDNGNRVDRKNARLKYTIDRLGLDVYKSEVESYLSTNLPPSYRSKGGYKLAAAAPYTFDRNTDDYGWHQGEDGRWHYVMFVENGRIQDEPGSGMQVKSGLAELARVMESWTDASLNAKGRIARDGPTSLGGVGHAPSDSGPSFRLTANQHPVVSGIPEDKVDEVVAVMRKWKLPGAEGPYGKGTKQEGVAAAEVSALRASSSACVAFPTCGLAMAESERYLPLLVTKVEAICEAAGLRNDSIVMRMTGCPNGCARPYLAEIAFVGKAPGTYLMLLGGGFYGQRLNKIYRESVTEPEILAILGPMIKRYALEREQGERFGDWTIRAGYISATTEGRLWYEGMGGNDQ
ncbi:hypothetical protein CYLTODRAFT_419457 [Cylindrobasidium torrendii FP15055 ss-10]|uniref:assimilatory sulfite reductase (NADPH) n=1 Tax=Cylindrobasidium torrendii FP15055 ss-10 TaxID=1314674 RepID=A0A0D7BJS3_9AGAR|nr:hypothetical protein CYLTODRAFT_419457 [Cylindrobasidium torrendii FP15055 ss-10]